MPSNHQENVSRLKRVGYVIAESYSAFRAKTRKLSSGKPAKLVSDSVKQVGTNNAARISGMRTAEDGGRQ